MLLSMPDLTRHQKPTRDTYATLAQVTMGQAGIYIVDASICITLFGAAALYQVTVSELLHQVYPAVSRPAYVFLCATLLIPFIFIRDIGKLAYVSGLAVFAYIGAFVVIYQQGSTLHPLTLSMDQLTKTAVSTTTIFESLGVVCFSLGVPILCFTLQESMAKPRNFVRTLDRTLACVAIAYIAIGVIGVAIFAQATIYPDESISGHKLHGVQPIILANMPSDSLIGSIAIGIVAAVLLFTSPLTFVPALGLLENIIFGVTYIPSPYGLRTDQPVYGSLIDDSRVVGGERKTSVVSPRVSGLPPGLTHYRGSSWFDNDGDRLVGSPDLELVDTAHPAIPTFSLRLTMLILVAVAATYVPCFTLIMSLIGCVTLNILSFILPPFFYMRIRQKYVRTLTFDVLGDEEPIGFFDACRNIGCWTFITFGVATMIGTTWLTIMRGQCE